MTRSHPGQPTQPLAPGAPLPSELANLPRPRAEDIEDELTRAQVELLYATAKHRKAWSAMRQRGDQIDTSKGRIAGMRIDMASDPIWELRTSDVRWWRDEMTAQATTVLALKAMLDDFAEVTVPGDAKRSYVPRR